MLNFFDKSKKESETAEEKKGFFQK
ncbi:MAG: Signal recognition particle receptor FtsY, partial [Caldanaerobacter subterraneus]